MIEKFYRTLFEPGESTCFSQTPRGTRVSPVTARTDCAFFTINALDAWLDHEPTADYHAPDRPRRADHNVVSWRNLLIEMDHGTLEQQLRDMNATDFPWTTCVSSGGKSLHFILSLRTPLADPVAYARLVKRIYTTLTPKLRLDGANKNPSRFSRCPGAYRAEKKTAQNLVHVGARVHEDRLERWLEQNGAREEIPRHQGQLLFLPSPTKIFTATENFLKWGAPQGEWNQTLFRAACNLFNVGHGLEETTARFRQITGTLDARDLATIRSAWNRARPRTGAQDSLKSI